MYSYKNLWLFWKDEQGRSGKSLRLLLSLLQESRRPPVRLELLLLTTSQINVCLAEGHLSARASTVESAWFAVSARAAEGNLQQNPKRQRQKRLSKERTRPETRNSFDGVKLQIAQKPWTSGNTFKQGQPETTLECSAHFAEQLTHPPVPRVDVYSKNQSQKQHWASGEVSFFDTEGCSGIDVKVPGTENPVMLVWVNAWKDEVQNCRQKIQAMRRQTAQDNLRQKLLTLRAKGDLEQEPQPLHKETWSVVPCSRDMPDKVESGFSKKTALLTCVQENVKVMEHSHGKNTSGLSKIRARTLPKESPYQILEQLTSQTKKERYEVCWKEGSKMTGQRLYQKIPDSVYLKTPTPHKPHLSFCTSSSFHSNLVQVKTFAFLSLLINSSGLCFVSRAQTFMDSAGAQCSRLAYCDGSTREEEVVVGHTTLVHFA